MWTNLATAFALFASTAASAIVKTTHGPIEGTTLTLDNGKQIDAFLGIPYAASPLRGKRFAPPQPIPPWNETLKVQRLPKTCPQAATDRLRKTIWYVSDQPEDEDCLYLNVWKPHEQQEKMPIMIWIHGGGLMLGSSNMPMYNPSYLVSETGVIVCSMNYRLAMFGFLYLNNSDVPGNAGLQDQLQAMRWIKDNAVAFGGDPDRITLFGDDAGAISVNAHLSNRNLTHLFRNAILQSGSLNPPAVSLSPSDAFQTSVALAKKLNCPVEDMCALLDCLRLKSPCELQNTVQGVMENGHVIYGPVRNGIEAPLNISNIAETVPGPERKNVIMGNIPREFGIIAGEIFPGKNLTDDFTVTLQEMTNTIKDFHHLKDDRLVGVVIHEYMNFDGTYNKSNLRLEILKALSDSAVLCPQITLSKQWISETNQVFYYYFARRPSRPIKYPVPEWLGTLHGDEIPFVFGTVLDPQRGYSDEDKKLSRTIMRYWSNFAKTGNPNCCNGEDDCILWPVLQSGDRFMHLEFLQNETATKLFLAGRECDFWNNVYPKLLSIQKQLGEA